MATPRRIILDVDPGHDDAIAILLAAGSPAIELAAITTVAGNQTLAKTTLNARRVCTVAGIRDVPVAAGMDRPLVREPVVAADIHGESGLDGPDFPEPTVPVSAEHAVDLIVRTLLDSDGDVTLVPTGPLTNIAMAMLREPKILPRIREIVLMGGAVTVGNVTPAAEFNIYADPEAARVVFRSGVPITMVPLELTHQATATPDVLERFRRLGTPLGRIVVDLLEFFGSTYRNVYGFEAPPVHDPCCVAWLIDPGVFTTRPMFVDVETRGELTYGRTVCDVYGVTGKPPNCRVAERLNRERFWELVVDAVARLGAKG